MKLNSGISKASLIRYLADVATTFAGANWIPGDNSSQTLIIDEASLESYFLDEYNPRVYPLKHEYPNLKNRYILVTADGIPTRQIALVGSKTHKFCGIIKITPDGKAYQLMWGLYGTKPTRRLEQHLAIHNAALSRDPLHRATAYVSTSYSQEYTYNLHDQTETEFAYTMWNGYPDLARFTPAGIGLVDDMLDPSEELWDACENSFKKYDVLMIKHQGSYLAAKNWDVLLGLAMAFDRAGQTALMFEEGKPLPIKADYFKKVGNLFNLKMNPDVLAHGEVQTTAKPRVVKPKTIKEKTTKPATKPATKKPKADKNA
ncbi:hypothetical protein [Mesoplasma lactucae]|uniref:hypothetical protein n=1 Tax=Mesoplasma lactucae TaxID=138853 RepID=UPI000CA29623|nr:hypothetical protein [Mesoplasma lactucae]ATZ19949.1 rhamnulose-1-phosphate aldolase [Mesoplasma lactucae ATCC 49193]MCL8217100.1 Rhamnulose-1-phosphate aldolase [Mesoplasma lactucae ATCC 49193]